MSNYKVKETEFGTRTSHPSYGTLAFRRQTGGSTPLFGSSIEHRDTISMTLYHADITRGLHNDSIYGKNPIAKVEMSYSQFAEAITSMNMGVVFQLLFVGQKKTVVFRLATLLARESNL